MKLVLPGGSGQVGTILARHFHAAGHEVVVLSRAPAKHAWRSVAWDGTTVGARVAEIDGADVVINLAGRSVNCRYTAANKRAMMESRLLSTRAVGQAIAAARRPPPVWLQASTATIYAHRFDAANDEETGTIGGDEPGAPAAWRFSIDIAQAWEREALVAATPNTRRVLLRSAMTMSPDAGGIFATLHRLVRLGLGGAIAGGRQYVSWIHDADWIRAIEWLIAHDEIDGVVNVAAPNPLPYRDFMAALRRAAGVPIGLPATAWMVALGTAVLQTEPELVLKSRRVVPGRLLGSGFTFRYPTWTAAAQDLCARLRQHRPEPRAYP